MAITNHDRVGRALDLLKAGLAPYAEREFTATYGDAAVAKAAEYLGSDHTNAKKSVAKWDVSALLKLMSDSWRSVFSNTLGHFERSLVSELRFIGERNRLIDNGELSADSHPRINLHMIHGDDELGRFPPSSKLLAEKAFLVKLKELGRDACDQWLKKHADDIGERSTFNYRRLVATLTQDSDEVPVASALSERD